jgi:23S rRNA (adenine1618-N6)-methyltransferase
MECDPPEHNTIQQFFYRGIDIGTGATCIYPLLLSTPVFSGTEKSTTQWKFLATDVDPTSVQSATQNIKANNLQERIHVVCVPKSRNNTSYTMLPPNSNKQKINEVCSIQGPIQAAMKAATESGLFLFQEGRDNTLTTEETAVTVPINSATYYATYPCFDFVMTNPPFYSTYHEADGCRIGDGRERTEMTKLEAVYDGGEYAFISDMIHDSMLLRSRITWYTSMMGKKTTLRQVEKKLRSIGLGRANIRTTEFIQGKTRRWGIAWTFQESPERLIGEQTCTIGTRDCYAYSIYLVMMMQ